MRTSHPVHFLTSLFILSFLYTSLPAQQASEILNKTHDAIANAKTLKYRSVMWERLMDGTEGRSETRIKMQCNPMRVYFLNVYPKDGVEVLYDTQKETLKALINPNGFPWVNVKLNIHSGHMRDGKHHSINHAGMGYFDEAIKVAEELTKAEGTFDEVFTYHGMTSLGSELCHKVTINNTNFHIQTYTVKEGEDLVSIAAKRHISEYKILELNPEIKGYFEVEAGQEIKIPSSYAKDITLYIHPENFIPVGIEIKDEKGLFEKYTFFEIEVNPAINPVEFTEDFSDYGF